MSKMNWTRIVGEKDLEELKELSRSKLCLVFKYSTSCPSSSVALDRLERNWNLEEMSDVQPYFLDLISYRSISNKVAEQFKVRHESPQILLIENGSSVFDTSHFMINYTNIRDAVDQRKAKSEN